MIISTGMLRITGKLVIDMRAREWCKLPYGRYKTKTGLIRYSHPNGCPNYNKSKTCPPKIGTVHEEFDLSKGYWIVFVRYDLGERAKFLQRIHPEWSDKKARCSRYWQSTVEKNLRLLSELVIKRTPCNKYTFRPEAMGVHVIKTAKSLDIPIKTRPKDVVIKFALVGCKKDGKEEK